MPLIFALGYFEGFPGTLLDLAARRPCKRFLYATKLDVQEFVIYVVS